MFHEIPQSCKTAQQMEAPVNPRLSDTIIWYLCVMLKCTLFL